MKIAALLITVLTITISSCAQDIPASKVPSIVQNTVQLKFANATKMEWEKKGEVYEAEFNMNNIEYTAHIDATGKLLLYKEDIAANDLPAAIKEAIARSHTGYTVDEAEKLEKDGVTYYQVELESKDKKDLKLVFAATGTIAQGITYMN